MKKTFYVCDSYHTAVIVEALEKAFPQSTVFTDRTKIPISEGTVMTAEYRPDGGDAGTERVDYFILSGRLIINGKIDPIDLKVLYGHEGSKCIAISNMHQSLTRIKDRVDYIESKVQFWDRDLVEKFFKRIQN